jgi:hypothetical protein
MPQMEHPPGVYGTFWDNSAIGSLSKSHSRGRKPRSGLEQPAILQNLDTTPPTP